MAAITRVSVCLLIAFAVHTQGQTADGSLWRSVETCQKVVKKHVTLAESTVSSTLQQFAESNSTMEIYVKRWGDLVKASRPGSISVVSGVDRCLETYSISTKNIADSLKTKLRSTLKQQIEWYDAEVFSLLTDALSEEGQAGIVQSVKFHLDPALKQFGSMAVSALKQSIKDMKSPYQNVALCIRDIEMDRSSV